MRVVVLGASGMLGSMLVRVLAAERDLQIVACARDPQAAQAAQALAAWPPVASWVPFDAEKDAGIDASDDRHADACLESLLEGADWAINAMGVIKSHIRDANPDQVERAIRVNALFPHRLARAALRRGTSVLQIATDCVYAGTQGAYTETDEHDALDVYGKTKSLGEVQAPHIHHLRTSIVGPELAGFASLLEWFRRQPRGALLNGFTNHRWNGVTTLHFARIAKALIRGDARMPGLLHLVPADTVSKHDLLTMFRDVFDRRDLTIRPTEGPENIDRTLSSNVPVRSAALWTAAGYAAPPGIGDMVTELGAWLAGSAEAGAGAEAEA